MEARPYGGETSTAEKANPGQVATFEELFRSMMYETKAVRCVLVRKGPSDGIMLSKKLANSFKASMMNRGPVKWTRTAGLAQT